MVEAVLKNETEQDGTLSDQVLEWKKMSQITGESLWDIRLKKGMRDLYLNFFDNGDMSFEQRYKLEAHKRISNKIYDMMYMREWSKKHEDIVEKYKNASELFFDKDWEMTGRERVLFFDAHVGTTLDGRIPSFVERYLDWKVQGKIPEDADEEMKFLAKKARFDALGDLEWDSHQRYLLSEFAQELRIPSDFDRTFQGNDENYNNALKEIYDIGGVDFSPYVKEIDEHIPDLREVSEMVGKMHTQDPRKTKPGEWVFPGDVSRKFNEESKKFEEKTRGYKRNDGKWRSFASKKDYSWEEWKEMLDRLDTVKTEAWVKEPATGVDLSNLAKPKDISEEKPMRVSVPLPKNLAAEAEPGGEEAAAPAKESEKQSVSDVPSNSKLAYDRERGTFTNVSGNKYKFVTEENESDKVEYCLVNGKKEGWAATFDKNGELKELALYEKGGKVEGNARYMKEQADGKTMIGSEIDGKPHGLMLMKDGNGKISKAAFYDKGVLIDNIGQNEISVEEKKKNPKDVSYVKYLNQLRGLGEISGDDNKKARITRVDVNDLIYSRFMEMS